MRSLSSLVLVALAGLLAVSPTGAAPSPALQRDGGARAPPEESGLAAPDSLPPLTRVLLRGRMRRHRFDMEELLRAVLLLKRPQVVALASQLAEEPSLAHPEEAGPDTLNAVLPPRFFQLDAQLRREAAELAEAARAGTGSDAALAERFGRLTRTCVSCHQTYQQAPRR